MNRRRSAGIEGDHPHGASDGVRHSDDAVCVIMLGPMIPTPSSCCRWFLLSSTGVAAPRIRMAVRGNIRTARARRPLPPRSVHWPMLARYGTDWPDPKQAKKGPKMAGNGIQLLPGPAWRGPVASRVTSTSMATLGLPFRHVLPHFRAQLSSAGPDGPTTGPVCVARRPTPKNGGTVGWMAPLMFPEVPFSVLPVSRCSGPHVRSKKEVTVGPKVGQKWKMTTPKSDLDHWGAQECCFSLLWGHFGRSCQLNVPKVLPTEPLWDQKEVSVGRTRVCPTMRQGHWRCSKTCGWRFVAQSGRFDTSCTPRTLGAGPFCNQEEAKSGLPTRSCDIARWITWGLWCQPQSAGGHPAPGRWLSGRCKGQGGGRSSDEAGARPGLAVVCGVVQLRFLKVALRHERALRMATHRGTGGRGWRHGS